MPIGEHGNCGRRQRLVDLARTAQQIAEEFIEPARHQLPSGAGCPPSPGAVTTVSPCAVAAIAAAVSASDGGTSTGSGPFRVAESRRSTSARKTSPVIGFADVGRSEEHTSELQSLMRSSYAVFCLKKKTK